MSFLVRRRQRESIRAHATVSAQAIALVLEAVDTSSSDSVPPMTIEARLRDAPWSAPRAPTFPSEHPPLLAETTASQDSETSPPVSESWRARAARKAYGSIAPSKADPVTPRCSRRC